MKTINYKNNWFGIYLHYCKLAFVLHEAGYFDERPYINIQLFIIELYISLPIKTGIDDCESRSWGFYLYGEHKNKLFFDNLWLRLGNKYKVIYMPWALDWIRTSNYRKDNTWEHETKGNRKDFWKDEWKDVIWNATFDYNYKLKSGKVQERKATIKVVEREWRPLWFKWTKLFAYIKRVIEVEFNDEIGEKTGSWKGGCVGCSYEIVGNETPYECLKRMERERIFN